MACSLMLKVGAAAAPSALPVPTPMITPFPILWMFSLFCHTVLPQIVIRRRLPYAASGIHAEMENCFEKQKA